ncbi:MULTISPECIES: TIGR03751 family conjugal transfer lipoprotein [unclassified Thioalkalivibrio]|uniref:TIGR03751 family conjugal transfer lipoprotein n=1 Tax=unclassified Thioalkalivibrio TaxID=2621013 RepID=UPI0012DF33C1|nr:MULTISPECIES: TIGR03751 family conjugal transfer lipoprotein [unclassified Thioalkalivibrio]
MKRSSAALPIALLISAVLTAGCASTSADKVIPKDGPTMNEVYEGHFESMGRTDVDAARQALQQPIGRDVQDGTADLAGYTRSAHDEIETRFSRVPNPTLVMFVYPHLAGRDEVPVPGYSTSFPMYDRHHYALPGEAGAR